MPEFERKPDSEKIREHLKTLSAAPWLRTSWWPQFVYHFAELKNTISILQGGRIYCRDNRAMKVDTASDKVIQNTDAAWTKFVRFYLRPRTPTLYQCEGIRPDGHYGSLGAHCPMPFVFLFDAADILTRVGTQFSDGNLGSSLSTVGDSADFFCDLPFQEIYHSSALLDPSTKQRIIVRRCAEVLVSSSIDLSGLKRIWCRSPAEYETLLNNLSQPARARFETRIGHGAQLVTHHRAWTYVENVTLEPRRITIRFNPSTKTPGPFRAVLSITSPQYGILEWSDEQFMTPTTSAFVVGIKQHVEDVEYDVRLTLDEHEAYYGQYRPEAKSLI